MLNCHNVTRLLSLELDTELNFSQKFALRLHLMACSGCRNFRYQLNDLRTLTRIFTCRDN